MTVRFSPQVHTALVWSSSASCFVLVLAVHLMHCMFNFLLVIFLDKLLFLGTEGVIIYCQQVPFPESVVVCLKHGLPPQLLVKVFVLSSDYRAACYPASCKSNLPFGQCNLASGRNIQKTELKQNKQSDFLDNLLEYLPKRNKLRRLFPTLNQPVHPSQTSYSKPCSYVCYIF